MSLFSQYLEATQVQYEKGKTYTYTYLKNKLKVKYLCTVKENKDIIPNSTIGDALTDKPYFLFRWLEGDGVPSSHGRKDDIVALGRKEAAKRIS